MLRPVEEVEEDDPLPFQGLDKATVLQDCKIFNDVTIKVPMCLTNLTNVLYLVSTGASLTTTEATELFFAATKLFQCEDQKLRRLLYMVLKELSGVAEQVFVASSSLVKDISSNSDIYRANAIRVLRKVTDCSMIGPMERYLKQAVVDKNNNVVSAAIVTGIHLSQVQPEMVKRWGTEVGEALKNRGNKVQYHALALLHKLRKNDRLSVVKFVQQAQNGPIRSPLAICLLIKMATEMMQEDLGQSLELFKFVSNMTHHSSDMVVFEAARSLCSLRTITAKEITPVVLVMQLYLTSHRPVLRFAAVRLLNRVATNHPSAVTSCNIDLETLISDPNRNIATLAITTLLKTGSEFNVERLMKQVASFLSDLSDEFKAVVIDAMKILSVKFPQKYPGLLQFMADALREDGGSHYKRTVVETMVSILESNPDAKDCALMHLCEFIEDCEYNALVQRVLYILGQHGPFVHSSRRFIRFINNRISLEAPSVRAVAVTTLAKFGAHNPDLRPSVAMLLRRTMADIDDEVRDRATFYYKLFSRGDELAIRSLVADVAESVYKQRAAIEAKPLKSAADVAEPQFAPTSPIEAAPMAQEDLVTAASLSLREKLRKIPQIKAFGEPLKTCEPCLLTEADSEYVISATKHIYSSNIVFQFRIQNTMEDRSFCRVSIVCDCSEMEGAKPLFAVPCSQIPPGQSEFAHVALQYNENMFPTGTVACAFRFAMCDAEEDPQLADIEEFPLDEFAANMCDFIVPQTLSNFEAQWTAMREQDTSGTYTLPSIPNLTTAAHQVIDFFGMKLEGERPEKITTKSYVVNMSGTLCNTSKALILISAKVFITSSSEIAMNISIRGGTEELRRMLIEALMS